MRRNNNAVVKWRALEGLYTHLSLGKRIRLEALSLPSTSLAYVFWHSELVLRACLASSSRSLTTFCADEYC